MTSNQSLHRQPITRQNAHQLTPIATFPVGWITELDWSPDGNTLAVANVEDLSLFKFQGNQVVRQRLTGHTEPLRTCHFSPHGEWIATAGDDGTIRLWNIAPTQPNQGIVIQTGGEVQQVRFSPDGEWIAAVVNDVVQIWETGGDIELTHTLIGHDKNVTTLAISPNGQRIASAGWDQTIRLWDATNGKLEATLTGHTERINYLTFMPKTTQLVSAARDGTIRVWDTSTFAELKIVTAHAATGIDGLAFNHNGAILVSGGRDHNICLWNSSSWQILTTLNTHTKPVMSIAFSPDNSLLASASGDNKVMIWAVAL